MEDPDNEYVPAEQVEHVVDPVVDEYLPAGQVSQLEAPAYEEYLPAGHDKQVPAPAPEYCPDLHLVQLDEPAVE